MLELGCGVGLVSSSEFYWRSLLVLMTASPENQQAKAVPLPYQGPSPSSKFLRLWYGKVAFVLACTALLCPTCSMQSTLSSALDMEQLGATTYHGIEGPMSTPVNWKLWDRTLPTLPSIQRDSICLVRASGIDGLVEWSVSCRCWK